MAGLNIYKQSLNEYTLLSNQFIDNYMEDANEAQLQVYLYLLRMIHANLPFTIEDIANKFKHSEKEVLRALKYWELQKLISLDFDENKNLVGIHLNTIPTQASVPSSVPASVPVQATATEQASLRAAVQPQAKVSAQVTHVSDASVEHQVEPIEPERSSFIKPAYTADQLKKFKEQGTTAQLLFIAQAYVGKPLSVNDIKTIYFMQDVLHFSDDLIDYLIQYCVERGKKDFRYMEKVAINWAEQGITSPKEAQAVSSRYDRSVYSVMNALGKSGNPTNKELEYINRWNKEYGFTNDVIIEACERTVLATDKHRFEYADKILSSWKQENVHHKADIISLDNHYQKQRNTAPKQSTNRFNQFSQNTYDFEALEKELLSN